ncbi:response regulator [Flavobacterium sp. F-380]|uniref:Response regulator n=1 Tax=Flavobacterium kayseriense TaxID=2764714 RepID=A0ABR7J8S1_9FLAO|nr:response regulator [Flavobacterium kayseriense]MBC5841887.1 response regulator [Flavobacterium kayseriense]MBC5848416.1 response regulator [Flavobacterium kayseriense]
MKKELYIIDDDNIYRMIASRMITRVAPDALITECENGQIGLSALAQNTNLDSEIIVLLDINMPILNGWGFLDQIVDLNFFKNSTIKIYIVSSSTDESDLLKAQQYDFLGGFLHKPLSKEDLISIIDVS